MINCITGIIIGIIIGMLSILSFKNIKICTDEQCKQRFNKKYMENNHEKENKSNK